MRRFAKRTLQLETLEHRSVMAGDSAADFVDASAAVILDGLNRGDHSHPGHDLSGDGVVTPLDALLAILQEMPDEGQGEQGSRMVIVPQLANLLPRPPAEAPTDPAELDEFFRKQYFFSQMPNPDGVTPHAISMKYYLLDDGKPFSIRLHWLGDDPDGSIYDAQIEFLNLPEGWSVTGDLKIEFPAGVEKLSRYDLRYRFVDSDGNASNISVLRLTFLDPEVPLQNSLNSFDANDDGIVDYFDLLTVQRQLEPQPPPPLQLGGVACMKYCEGWTPIRPNPPFADVNGDQVVNEIDLEVLAQHLQQASVIKLPPVVSNPRFGLMRQDGNIVEPAWVAGRQQDIYLPLFGHDPDGDERSFTIELLSDAPFTIDHSASGLRPGFVRVIPHLNAAGIYEVRYRTRDLHGLVSEEGIITVSILPPNAPYWNSALASDVDDDGQITPLDALKVIMLLEQQSQGQQVEGDTPPLWDVNADGKLSPLDALLVIIQLNSQRTA